MSFGKTGQQPISRQTTFALAVVCPERREVSTGAGLLVYPEFPRLSLAQDAVCRFLSQNLCASRTARALTLGLLPRDTLHATLSVTPPCPALWRYILHAASCCHGAWAGRLLALRGSTGWRYFSLFFVWVMCMASLSPGQARLTSAHGLL